MWCAQCVAHGTQGGPLFILPWCHVQVGTLQVTGLLFRPLVHGVCLHLASCIDLPSGSRALGGGGHCVVLVTVTALGDLWSHQLMLSPMPVSPFNDKVASSCSGWLFCCGSPPALYVFCCGLETRSPVLPLQEALGRTGNLIVVQRTPPPTSKQECGSHLCLSYVGQVCTVPNVKWSCASLVVHMCVCLCMHTYMYVVGGLCCFSTHVDSPFAGSVATVVFPWRHCHVLLH